MFSTVEGQCIIENIAYYILSKPEYFSVIQKCKKAKETKKCNDCPENYKPNISDSLFLKSKNLTCKILPENLSEAHLLKVNSELNKLKKRVNDGSLKFEFNESDVEAVLI